MHGIGGRMNDARFEVLVEKYVEGSLSEEEARELLEAPEPWRSRLLDEVSMASALSRVHGRAPADLPAKVRSALREPSAKDRLRARVLDRIDGGRPRRRLFVAAALLLAAVGIWRLGRPAAEPAPVPAPAPVAGRVPPAPEVRAAMDRAVAWLRTAKLPECEWNKPLPSDELVLLALHKAGVPADDAGFQALLGKTLAAKLQRTYSVSLQAELLASLDPVKHRARLAECAQFLVDNQCLNGQWSYGTPGGVPAADGIIRKSREGPVSGNNSCTLFAAHGLRACAAAGLKIPQETLERAARSWRDTQRPEPGGPPGRERGGWCYTREEHPHRPYGSMSAGGLGALVVLDRMLGADWRKDAAAAAGLNWLDAHFTVFENHGPVEELMAKEMSSDTPNPMTEYYYYLWQVERAATACGLSKIAGRDWYADGVAELLHNQDKNGSWYGGAKRCQRVYDTCYALLFLSRATRPFGE